jgi:hypothetical protein
MRTVLLGTDFMYNKEGQLIPIEINTAVGWHNNKLESDDEVFNLSNLITFINNNSFTKITYVGNIDKLNDELINLTTNLSLVYEYVRVDRNSITIPEVEDGDDILIIRSAYDATTIVDETYCADKIEFLKLIESQTFGSQFAYINEIGELINNITEINDNGGHPNFILKYRHPSYDKDIYPRLFRVSTLEELSVILQNVNSEYFLMEYHFNLEKTYQNHISVVRELSLHHPPSLNAIQLGSYSTFCNDNITTPSQFHSETFEIIGLRSKYISGDRSIKLPKLQNTDLVTMADGTMKTGLDLEVGDYIKTIDIPNPFDVNKPDETVNYKISFSDLQNGTVYSTNRVNNKVWIDTYCDVVKLKFTDGTDWLDTKSSFYLSVKDNEVRFLSLVNNSNSEYNLSIGDSIILLDATNETPTFIEKEVTEIEYTKEFFGGWVITVENEFLFLTRASDENDISYVAIEHNNVCDIGPGGNCVDQGSCGKSEICCNGFCQLI